MVRPERQGRRTDKTYVKRMMKSIKEAKKKGNDARAARLARELAIHMDLYEWYDDDL